MPARRGTEPLRSGKLEALFLEEPYRGRRPDGEPVVRELLTRLYAFADEHELDVVHAYATPRIGRVIGFDPLEGVGEPSLVAIASPRSLAGASRRRRRNALPARQCGPRSRSSGKRARTTSTSRPRTRLDRGGGRRWRRTHGTGTAPRRSCACSSCRTAARSCRSPGKPGEPLRLVGWRAERAGVRPAAAMLASLARRRRRAKARGRCASNHGTPRPRTATCAGPAACSASSRAAT